MKKGTAVKSCRVLTRNFNIFTRYAQPFEPLADVPLVLIPGLGLSGRYMKPLLSDLGKRYDVYSLDLPGFGKSVKPPVILDVGQLSKAVIEWMNAIGQDRAVLIGHSFGCQVCVECALRHPGRIRAIVLISPTGDPQTGTVPAQLSRWVRYAPRQWFSPQIRYLSKDYSQCGPRRFWKTFLYSLKDPMWQKIPAVRRPTLIIRGKNDPIVSRRWGKSLADHMPKAILDIEEGSHTLNYSHPETVAARIRSFIHQQL